MDSLWQDPIEGFLCSSDIDVYIIIAIIAIGGTSYILVNRGVYWGDGIMGISNDCRVCIVIKVPSKNYILRVV